MALPLITPPLTPASSAPTTPRLFRSPSHTPCASRTTSPALSPRERSGGLGSLATTRPSLPRSPGDDLTATLPYPLTLFTPPLLPSHQAPVYLSVCTSFYLPPPTLTFP